MILYLFALAAVIAGLGMMILFRQTVDAIVEGSADIVQIRTRFFMSMGFIEFIPIVMIVIGFVVAQDQSFQLQEIFLPAAIIIAIVISLLFFTLSQQTQAGANAEKQAGAIRVLALLTIAIGTSIPIIAIIFMFVLINS